jgi:hypothetical protein
MNMQRGRREFVSGGGLVLAGLAAGTITGTSAAQTSAAETSPPGRKTASFGWEVTNLNDNGASAYFEVVKAMILDSVHLDAAFMLTALPASPGFVEVLCRAAISHGAPKFFPGDPGGSFVSPQSPDFGATHVHNPNKLNVGRDGVLLQDIFYSVILKAWVPGDGAASSTSRHVSLAPSFALNAGDFLVLNMSHAGVPGDAEMHVVVEYMLA